MDQIERDELLIRLDERVDNIREDQKDLHKKLEGDGFARCQVHDNQLKKIESTVKWGSRGLVGGSVILIGKFIYGIFMPSS